MQSLKFEPAQFKRQTLRLDGRPLAYYAVHGLTYVRRPVAAIQRLNVFVPAAYLQNKPVNGYDRTTAPIFMPNTVGGYLPGPADDPQNQTWPSNAKTIAYALKRGYVVVAAGLRGRTTVDANGHAVGHAPAFIVDMKAAIRYVRYNAGRIPGDVERIVTNGTSAGGATAALSGAAGNVAYFDAALTALGAAPVRDDVFAVSAYCPIHNLQHADMAYEWQFNGIDDWHRFKSTPVKNGRPRFTPVAGRLTSTERMLSRMLKTQFISYLNDLHLTTAAGTALTLDAAGNGPFRDAVAALIQESAQVALDHGTDVHKYAGLTVRDNRVTAVDLTSYLNSITRMKSVPAFDALDLSSPENNLFGDANVNAKHFTVFSQKQAVVSGPLAAPQLVAAVDPVSQLLSGQTTVAKHWRIRHGAADRDTSFAIPLILATVLRQRGADVDLAFPWDVPHSGDYDLGALFSWIDARCLPTAK
ncbi:tannase [Lactiplantibacillus garii]|uniref:Tannase n=1 Tax=Lactiplantibacillus garii TaxID=2306423 RepID=A0A3R8J7D4_9LACO|nr:subtype B tannase [Lactiplantibacillus garii]RRK10560.1 tannase [Lactiplantibacillus garii]